MLLAEAVIEPKHIVGFALSVAIGASRLLEQPHPLDLMAQLQEHLVDEDERPLILLELIRELCERLEIHEQWFNTIENEWRLLRGAT